MTSAAGRVGAVCSGSGGGFGAAATSGSGSGSGAGGSGGFGGGASAAGSGAAAGGGGPPAQPASPSTSPSVAPIGSVTNVGLLARDRAPPSMAFVMAEDDDGAPGCSRQAVFGL